MFLYANTDPGRSQLRIDAHRLIYPLGLSLALHAMVIWSAHEVSPSPDTSAARQNRLHGSLQQTSAAMPVEKPLFDPAPSPEKAPTRAPEKPVQPSPETSPAEKGSDAGPPEREYGETRPATPIEPVRSGVDLAGLRQYHLALGRKAQQFRRYPEEARTAGWRGRITMRLVVSEAGYPLGISLLGSSGYPALDRAALEMMLLSASHTEVPESLRGQTFNIDLAIDYNPDDAP